MIKVPIYSNINYKTELVGYIVWDGERLTSSPPDNRYLQQIIESPVFVGNNLLSSKEDPEQWINLLPLSYRGTLEWAGRGDV